jgi:hypothetical protein
MCSSVGTVNPALDASVSISLLCNYTVPASLHFAFHMSMHSYPSRMRALPVVQVHNTPSSAPLREALQAALRDMLRTPPHAGAAAAGSAAASTAMTRRRILEGDAKRALAQSGAEAEAVPSSPVARGLLSEALVAYAAAAGVGPHGSGQGSAGAAAPGAEGAAEAAQAALRLALLCSSLVRVRPVRAAHTRGLVRVHHCERVCRSLSRAVQCPACWCAGCISTGHLPKQRCSHCAHSGGPRNESTARAVQDAAGGEEAAGGLTGAAAAVTAEAGGMAALFVRSLLQAMRYGADAGARPTSVLSQRPRAIVADSSARHGGIVMIGSCGHDGGWSCGHGGA